MSKSSHGKFVLRINKTTGLWISIFIITFSGSLYINNLGIQSIFEYIGYGILLILIIKNFIEVNRKRQRGRVNIFIVVIALLFSVGILVQSVTVYRKTILLFTMFAILATALMSEGVIASYKTIKMLSYAINFAVLLSLVLALISGVSITGTGEGILGYIFTFNGGILYKNYFAADMLAAFMGFLLCWKGGNKLSGIDKVILVLDLMGIVFSGSRGTYLLLAVFLIIFEIDQIRKIKSRQRVLLVLFLVIIGVIVALWFFMNIALNSDNYLYRFRGFTNYINYYAGDIFHIIFGDAEMAYDQGTSYVMAVRSTVGWNGSLEFSWLDIMIKNGLLGVIGFVMIFVRFFKYAYSTHDWKNKAMLFAFLITCLASSFVETYIQSVHTIFGIYCYLIMAAVVYNIQTHSRSIANH